MPADDLILNIRQIAGYPDGGVAQLADYVLLQRGGLGGPYISLTAQVLVETALAQGGPLSVGWQAPADAIGAQIFTGELCLPLDGWIMWNCYASENYPDDATYTTSGPAALMTFDPASGWNLVACPPGSAGQPVHQALIEEAINISPGGYVSVADQVLLGRDPAAPLEAATAQWVEAGFSPLQAGWPNPAWAAPPDAWGSQLFATELCVPLDGWVLWNCYVNLSNPDDATYITDGVAAAMTFDPTSGFGFVVAQAGSAGQPLNMAGLIEAINISPTGYVSVADQVLLGRDPAAPLEAATMQWVSAGFSPVQAGWPTPGWPAPPDAWGSQVFTAEVCMSEDGYVMWNCYVSVNIPDDVAYTTDGSAAVLTFDPVDGWTFIAAPPGLAGTAVNHASIQGSMAISHAGLVTVRDQVVLGRDPTGPMEAATAQWVINSPNFQGVPTAPTAPPTTATAQIATCAYVRGEIASGIAGVASFNTRVGNVVLNNTDIRDAGGALLASPAFTGNPTAPTQGVGTNDTTLATCAFVLREAAAIDAGVLTFNNRSGIVTLMANDISAAGGVMANSPAFIGVPTAPTAAPGTATTQLATTGFVTNSPIFAGTPTAPTAAPGAATTQVATTAFVDAAVKARADPVPPGFNLLDNSDFLVNQRNAGEVTTENTSAVPPVDRWWGWGTTAVSRFSIWQAYPPNWGGTWGEGPPGHSTWLACRATLAGAVQAAAYYVINQVLISLQTFWLGFGGPGALPLTLSFWVKSSIAGTYAVSLSNNMEPGTRSLVTTYNIPTANVWTKISVSIPGDLGGDWTGENAAGTTLALCWNLGCGANFQAPNLNVWNAAAYVGHASAVNLVSTNNATFYLAGVKLEAGTVATEYVQEDMATMYNRCTSFFQIYYNILAYTSYGLAGYPFWNTSTYTQQMWNTPTCGFSSVENVVNCSTAQAFGTDWNACGWGAQALISDGPASFDGVLQVSSEV
jgi:hypothetical protein